MEKKEIFDFLNQYTVASVATIENNQPKVRKMWTVKSDENGIMFHTNRSKPIFSQLNANPNAEFCFSNEDDSVQIRVSGKAELLNDESIKNELAEKRPFLQAIAEKLGGFDFLSVFLLKECVATVWTMEANMAPKQFVDLT